MFTDKVFCNFDLHFAKIGRRVSHVIQDVGDILPHRGVYKHLMNATVRKLLLTIVFR